MRKPRSWAQRDAQLKASQASANARYRRAEERQRRAEEEANKPPHQHRWDERNTEVLEEDGAVYRVSRCLDPFCDETRRERFF